MPKEQPCLREQSPGATCNKNAKDKSNSRTLMAIRDSKEADDSSGRGSQCSSEKDSGYSDGSDWHQTDVEDQRMNRSQSRGGEHAELSQLSQNRKLGKGNSGNPTFKPVGHELSPIYIIKNMVLKKEDLIQKRSQLLWRNGSGETSGSGGPQMILVQQPSLLPAPVQLRKPLSRNSVTKKKINDTYLPILNSYPRIAPHTNKKPPDKSLLTEESQNLSKRMCTEHKIDTPVTRSLPDQHLFKHPKFAGSASVQLCSSSGSQSSSSSTTSSSSQVSQCVSSLHSNSSSLTTRRLHRNGTTSTRHRRFLNTVEVLRQSGLLDITLRTKELLRQSNATERDISQLRQHTELLWQAACSHNLNAITTWEHLYRAMAKSGNYPDIANLQVLTQPDSSAQPETISTLDTSRALCAENSDVSSSRLSTSMPDLNQNCTVLQQSHSKQGREFEASDKFSEKVTFMHPDSSTD